MSILKRVQSGASIRAATLSNPAEWLVNALTGNGATAAGEVVTPASALGLAAFWRGVQLLSGSVGMLPLDVYQETADDRAEVPRTSRPWQLLHDRPNEDMAADEHWALVESHVDTWGNSFQWKEYGRDGRVANLWPLAPNRVQVARLKDKSRSYVIDGNLAGAVGEKDILHIRGLSLDGLIGYSPVQIARQELGAAQARQKFAGTFWANDATPGVTLIHPQKLSPDATDRLRALWDDRHKGSSNRRKTAVLGEAVEVKQMTMPLDDAQYVEQEQWGATKVALVLGVPPYMLGGTTGDSLTYSTTEGYSLDFLKYSLSPRLVRIQNAVSQDQDIMPANWCAEFDTGAIMRATTEESYRALGLVNFMTVDEKRKKVGLGALPDGSGDTLSPGQGVTLKMDGGSTNGDS